MSATSFAGSELPVRADLLAAHERAWSAIAAPGTWLTGVQRVDVAAEIRHARACEYCARIKAALSPNGVPGAHQSLGKLGAAQVELIHRVVGDPGRLSEKWSQSVLALGLAEGEYVETVGIVAMVMMLDTCLRALGVAERALPAPQSGAPTRYRPAGAKKRAAWLPLVEPEDATEADGPLYPNPKAGYIYRGLSLVPQSLRDYWALANCHYMPGEFVYQFDKSIRAIRRPQVEIIAARVSAMHQCVY
jgi:alkylhydroperoxidase family enzyme